MKADEESCDAFGCIGGWWWRVLKYAVLDWKARPRMVVYQGRCWLRLGLVLGTLGWAGLTGICDAQTKVNLSSPQGTDPVEKAFLSTLQTGRPILLAITSRNSSEPRELWKAMLQTNRARELASAVQLVELVVEDDPARVRQLGVAGTPSLCILRRGQTGIEKVAQQAMPRDPGSLLEWVNWTAGTTATTTKPAVDPAIERTSHPGILTVQPSPQSPQLPVYPVPSAAPAQTLQTIPVVTTPAAPPVAITMSSPPVYIQQAAPTVVAWSGTSSQRRRRPGAALLPYAFAGRRTRCRSDNDQSESSSPIARDGSNGFASSNAVRGATVHGVSGSRSPAVGRPGADPERAQYG